MYFRRVAILSRPNQALFELGCAVELFCLPRTDVPDNWYSGEVVSFDAFGHQATGGISIKAKRVSSLDEYDMLVVPSWFMEQGCIPAKLSRAIFSLYERGGRIVSFCSGAFLLAELGLLAGRKATTHWRYADCFQQRFPEVQYVENVLYEFEGQVGSSAGSAAGLDLGLEMIRQDYGHKVANTVARSLVVSAQRAGGQSQYVNTPMTQRTDILAGVIDWALKNLNKDFSVNELASRAKMSRRSFDRKFRDSLGVSPKAWVIQQRLNLVKLQLEERRDSMDVVALNAGFESAVTLRHHFRKAFGISPTAYRESVSRAG